MTNRRNSGNYCHNPTAPVTQSFEPDVVYEALSKVSRRRYILKELCQYYTKRQGGVKVIEIGVQTGQFAKVAFEFCPNITKYVLVDIWDQQTNYNDLANVDLKGQNEKLLTTRNRLKPFEGRLVYLIGRSDVVYHMLEDDSKYDIVYIDARHDYCGCKVDIEIYYKFVRQGGIVAGHDYVDADRVKELSNGKDDFSVCEDGTVHKGAVKGAVDEFVAAHNLRLFTTFEETKYYPSWMTVKLESD